MLLIHYLIRYPLNKYKSIQFNAYSLNVDCLLKVIQYDIDD